MAIFCVIAYSIENILWPQLSINPGTLDNRDGSDFKICHSICWRFTLKLVALLGAPPAVEAFILIHVKSIMRQGILPTWGIMEMGKIQRFGMPSTSP